MEFGKDATFSNIAGHDFFQQTRLPALLSRG